MANIEFSELGRAVLDNKLLADHLSYRLSNITPQEDATGKIEIKLKDGNTLVFRFGPEHPSMVNNLKNKLQPA